MGKDTRELREEIDHTRDRMGDTVDAIAYKADVPSRMQDAVGDRIDSVKSVITGSVGTVRDKLGSVMPDTGQMQEQAANAVGAIRENPLGILLGSVAVGFLLGSLMPATRIENERLGEFSDRLKQTAQDASGQLLESGKAVMKDTMSAAKEAATQSAVEHGSEVARDARQSMRD